MRLRNANAELRDGTPVFSGLQLDVSHALGNAKESGGSVIYVDDMRFVRTGGAPLRHTCQGCAVSRDAPTGTGKNRTCVRAGCCAG